MVGKNWKDLGRAVAYARKRAGWTQTDLSTMIETKTGEAVSSRTIGSLERGEPVLDTTLHRVAVALDWSPSTPQAILDNLQPVGLAGELLQAGAPAQFGGSGTLTTMVPPRGTATARDRDGITYEFTLSEARQAVADHEGDFRVAAAEAEEWIKTLRYALQGHLPSEDPLDLLEQVSNGIDKMVSFDQGRQFWQRQVDVLRRGSDDALAVAARRGRQASENPEPHAE